MPIGEEPVHVEELNERAYDSHQGAAGDKAGSDQGTLVHALVVNLLVLGPCADVPGDRSTDKQREVEVDRDEHSQGEGQGGNLEHCQKDGDHGSNAIQQPRGSTAVHHRLDHSGHGVGLGSDEGLVTHESVSLVEDQHDSADSGGGDSDSGELPTLLLFGRASDPVTDLEVGDEGSGNAESCADNSTDDQGSGHAGIAFQAHGHED